MMPCHELWENHANWSNIVIFYDFPSVINESQASKTLLQFNTHLTMHVRGRQEIFDRSHSLRYSICEVRGPTLFYVINPPLIAPFD